ncbi:MAG: hypothetical protein K0S65_5243 [Labilithrix sp.]|nr:hypothetical protein [Labilithrix sp.]
MNLYRSIAVTFCLSTAFATAACGGSAPPPKTEEAVKEEPKVERPSGGPTIEQELGSIDQRAVEKKFFDLQGKLESCHKQGRDRVEYLSGDVKVFLRVGKDGRVRYSWFEESTLGDRDTEKCILDLFAATDWPKPVGGEAEVRNGFGWPAGSERAPTSWGPEKVVSALDDDKHAKKDVEKCKSGVSGDFRITAYVEPGEVEESHGSGHGAGQGQGTGQGKGGGKKAGRKGDKMGPGKGGEHGGKFKTIGVAPPNKEGAEKIDCIVDALKNLPLPSPGSYAAKVTFTL